MAHKEENTTGASAPVIDAESAELEFQRMADLRDLDIDEEAMDVEDRTKFQKIKRRVISAIQSGRVTINEDGEITVILRKHTVKSVTFIERDGAMMMGTDKYKERESAHKTYGLMASMTKTHASTFAKMKEIDLKLCEGIFLLLMD